MFPYAAGQGTRLLDGVHVHQLDLISSTRLPNGVLDLQYRRHR
jgi:hypothetical protein